MDRSFVLRRARNGFGKILYVFVSKEHQHTFRKVNRVGMHLVELQRSELADL